MQANHCAAGSTIDRGSAMCVCNDVRLSRHPCKGQAGTFRILPALDWSFNNFSCVSFERGARACAPTTTCAHTKSSMSPVHVTACRPVVIGALLLPKSLSIFDAAHILGKSGLCGACLTLSLWPTAHGGRVGGGGWLRQCKGRQTSVRWESATDARALSM
jgi:hypothetical protein